jgi:hypothetical protein
MHHSLKYWNVWTVGPRHVLAFSVAVMIAPKASFADETTPGESRIEKISHSITA